MFLDAFIQKVKEQTLSLVVQTVNISVIFFPELEAMEGGRKTVATIG